MYWIFVIVVIGIIWGGFVVFLTKAIKFEKLKSKNIDNN